MVSHRLPDRGARRYRQRFIALETRPNHQKEALLEKRATLMNREYDDDGDFVIRPSPSQGEYSESERDESENSREYDYADEEAEDDNEEDEELSSQRPGEFGNFENEQLDEDEENEERPFSADSGTGSHPAFGNEGHRAPASLQQMLGYLSRSMETHESTREQGSSSLPGLGNRQGRRVEIADIFPEIFGFAGNGPIFGPNRANPHITKLLENIASCNEDPYVAQESLREISEQLLMMNSITAERAIPQEELLTNVIQILESSRLQDQLELQMVAGRCLYNLFEVNPSIIAAAVDLGVVAALREKLLEISYIDLAEQVLETLEIISRLHGREILESGTLTVCLQYLDFFTLHAQRKALTIVVNACTRARVQDFAEIANVMPILKQVFMGCSDSVLLLKVFDGLYGICSSFSKERERLTQLFQFDLVEKIMQLSISGETKLETRLKAFDILTQLVLCSRALAVQMIKSRKVPNLIQSSIDGYKKNQKSPLQERIMFAPKSLLTCVSRFLMCLLPVEGDHVLSNYEGPEEQWQGIEDEMKQLLTDVTPVLVEIYDNAVDFQIRKYVLVALARTVSPRKSSASFEVNERVISMIASSFARNKTVFEDSNLTDKKSGALLVGCASLTRLLIERNSEVYLPAFYREGVFEMIDALLGGLSQSSLDKEELDHESNSHSSAEEDLSEDSHDHYDGDDYDMDFDGIEGLGQVKARKISFNVLKKLTLHELKFALAENLKIISSISKKGKSSSEQLGEISTLVEKLQKLVLRSNTYEEWLAIWRDVKNKLLSSEFVISSFEFMSTGLAREMSKIIIENRTKSFFCEPALIDAFGGDLRTFVQILQSSLTRIECFSLMECGLHDENGKSASLGKQMKIKLEYDGDHEGDKIPANLRSITVAIHCIATFKSLNDFLKHRILQSRVMSSSSPLVAITPAETTGIDGWNFAFFLEEKECKYQDTIFGPIFRAHNKNEKEGKRLWTDVHVFKFREILEPKQETRSLTNYTAEQGDAGADEKQAYDLMIILRALRKGPLGSEHFINSKISAKLSCQLDEPLIVASGCIPAWSTIVTRRYPFLFPLELRMFYLQCASFGYARLIQIWKNRLGGDKGERGENVLHQLGRPTRHKLRISRDNMFLSALKILSKYGSSPNILEIEYSDEVGTGLGPTMEFYAIISKEFAKKSLGLWRTDRYPLFEKDELVDGLLFPASLSASKDQTGTLELFKHLGAFVARSMLDNRILDFRFNTAFLELAHLYADGENVDLGRNEATFSLLHKVDHQLAKSLQFLLEHKGANDLESLSLTFHLPGYDVDLIPNGRNIAVTAENFDDYFDLLVDQILGAGIEKQIRSFMEGFSQAFPYSSLLILTPDELTELFGRVEEDWSLETLLAYVEADHGYTQDSDIIHDLISLMTSFSITERRDFLQFLTGSPKLPLGGFKSLTPKLTVVRKHTEENMTADEYLPSVMTCANYLKLPMYSDRDILRSRITQAMTEGSGAFLLS
ncbi:LAFA_0F08856g1_1 [Lachancea sp. 'fantastica']|nr:LAFA_0F08856g1_1 [Lachancea sp. 'fantastica']